MHKEIGSDITSFETENRKLAYANEFRSLLKENPGIIKTAEVLIDKAIDEYNPPDTSFGVIELTYDKESGKWFEKGRKRPVMKDRSMVFTESGEPLLERVPMGYGRGTILVPGKPVKDDATGLELNLLGRSNREFYTSSWSDTVRVDKCDYLRLNFKGESFFLKRSFVTTNPGFVEFSNVTSAKEALKDLDFVRVVDAQLGYQDKNESWYVSKWEDLERAGFSPHNESVNDYGEITAVPRGTPGSYLGYESEDEYNQVQERVKTIKQKLTQKNIQRDLAVNLFYNRVTKTFMLLDVTGEDPDKTLGNPIRED